ncbi:hypothetical protein [Streptomyces sp. NBC_00063]|uniref:hypothetical protein n=1 Tax=Streptomyces sp. NBC_00063 TaxID=2975638 RepID=UPI003D743F43
MSAKSQNTPKADKNHPLEEISFKAGRFIELAHKFQDGSPTSIAVVLLLLIIANFGVFVGFDWAGERARLPEQACQGLAFAMLFLALAPSFLIVRGMLRRQAMSLPKQSAIPEKPAAWDKPPEKLKATERNAQGAITEKGESSGLISKQSTKEKNGRRRKADRGV